VPNSSGYPLKEEIAQWQLDEQKRLMSLEYQLPRDRDLVIQNVCSQAARECMEVCGKFNVKYNKQQIEARSKFSCEAARDTTKARSFVNRYDDYEELARPVYQKAYTTAQDIFSRNYRLLERMQRETELYGWACAYPAIQRECEHAAVWGK
jgi:hypothetical protein